MGESTRCVTVDAATIDRSTDWSSPRQETAVVVVVKDRKQVAKIPLFNGQVTIGRLPQCSIVLEDGAVSRQHAIIECRSGAYFLHDKGSHNGTLLNGAPLQSETSLADADEIIIGPFHLTFYQQEPPSATMPGDPSPLCHRDNKIVAGIGKLINSFRIPSNAGLDAQLVVLDGPLKGERFKIPDSGLNIGRGAENHLVLPDDAVSTTHARASRLGGDFYLEDLNSGNGTFVQGVRIKRERLTGGQHIRVGCVGMRFVVGNARRRKWAIMVAIVLGVWVAILLVVALWLRPESAAIKYARLGNDLLAKKQYSAAGEAFEMSLKSNSGNAEARQGLSRSREMATREEDLKTARTALEEGKIEKAAEMCRHLLAHGATQDQVLDLDEQVKAMEGARIAFEARNWVDAIRLYKEATLKFPRSGYLSRRLEETEAEKKASDSLARARDCLLLHQGDVARDLIASIGRQSVYYVSAQELLEQLNASSAVADATMRAQELYQAGDVAKALEEVRRGLRVGPDNRELQQLQVHLQRLRPLSEKIRDARTALKTDQVPDLLGVVETCDALLKIENDPLNSLVAQAQELKLAAQEKLGATALATFHKAIVEQQAGRDKEALRMYEQTLLADPKNQEAKAALEDVRRKMQTECKNYYQRGLVHEELGQTEMAISAYREAQSKGTSGEVYGDLAAKKLLRLKE